MKSAEIYPKNKSKDDIENIRKDIDTFKGDVEKFKNALDEVINDVKKAKSDKEKIEKKPEISKIDDDGFEKLFYGVIDVFAYSKFYDITFNPHERSGLNHVNLVRIIHENFTKNQKKLSILYGEETYENLVLIVNEFCAEKFKNFINIRAFVKNREEADEKISEFLSVNNQSIELIKKEIEKNPEHENLEIIIKNLQKKDPKRFKNLIDFEVNRIELKNINDVIGYMASDKNMKPSPLFLKEVKECSRLQGSDLNKNKFSCVIS